MPGCTADTTNTISLPAATWVKTWKWDCRRLTHLLSITTKNLVPNHMQCNIQPCDFVNTCMLQFIDRMWPNCIACVYWALCMHVTRFRCVPCLISAYTLLCSSSVYARNCSANTLKMHAQCAHVFFGTPVFDNIASCTITYLLYHPHDEGVKHRMMKYLVSVIITYNYAKLWITSFQSCQSLLWRFGRFWNCAMLMPCQCKQTHSIPAAMHIIELGSMLIDCCF